MRHDLSKMMHTVEVTKLIVQESDYKIDPDDALDMFRASHIYQCLLDDDSGLYGESSLYIFSLFKEEQKENAEDSCQYRKENARKRRLNIVVFGRLIISE